MPAPTSPVLLRTCAVYAPYMRNTRAAAPSDFTAKSEGAAAMVRRWYGDGGGMVRGWQGDGREAGGVARQGHGGGRGTGGGIFALRSKTATRHATSLQRPWGLHLRGARYAHGEVVGGGIFALRRPRPYSRRWRGGRCDACGIDHHLRPRRDQQERRRGGLRCGAPLRPSRNGRIGFKPPYSKREPRRKARRGAIVYRRFFLRVKRFQSSNSISRRP